MFPAHHRNVLIGACLSVLLSFGPVDTAFAQNDRQITPYEAEAIARAKLGGRVLETRKRWRGGQQHYEVTVLLSNGYERKVRVDVKTGDPLEFEVRP